MSTPFITSLLYSSLNFYPASKFLIFSMGEKNFER